MQEQGFSATPIARPAEIADAGRLLEIQRLSPEAAQWTDSDLRALLAGKGASRCTVADGQGQVLGLLVYLPLRDGEAEILNLAVDPAFRGRGVGALLLQHLLDQGFSKIYLEVRSSNHSAVGFYRRAGFAEVGRRRAYYSDPAEDALVMALGSEDVSL